MQWTAHALLHCRAYQRGFKYGDLNAQKLAEALIQKPHASAALTELLQNVRMVATEQDVPSAIYMVSGLSPFACAYCC